MLRTKNGGRPPRVIIRPVFDGRIKRRKCWKPAFSPFPTMFYTYPKTHFNFIITFILLSANVFILDQSKIWLFGIELRATISPRAFFGTKLFLLKFPGKSFHAKVSFNNPRKKNFANIVGKASFIKLTTIFSFSHYVLNPINNKFCHLNLLLTLYHTIPTFNNPFETI